MNVLGRVLCLGVVLLLAWWAISLLAVNKREATIAEQLANAQPLVGDATRGQYVASMSGCIACHTDVEGNGPLMAGGVPIQTPFGTFYSPNITPDSVNGIGNWTTADFLNAMTLGLAPNGQHYFPSFPYTSYTVMQRQDLADLYSWLTSLEPVDSKSQAHDLLWFAPNRSAMVMWKALFFSPQYEREITDRGRYLVEGPGHCRECHAPRNRLGGLNSEALSGNRRGPEGHAVPGISADDLRGWEIADLELFLEVGITPAGDFTGGHMADVIEYSTSRLTSEDRTMIATYLLSGEN